MCQLICLKFDTYWQMVNDNSPKKQNLQPPECNVSMAEPNSKSFASLSGLAKDSVVNYTARYGKIADSNKTLKQLSLQVQVKDGSMFEQWEIYGITKKNIFLKYMVV